MSNDPRADSVRQKSNGRADASPARPNGIEAARARDDRTWMLRLARAIHEFAHIQSTNAAKWMKPLGVSVAQSNVLIGISWHTQINSSHLAKTLGLTKASVGRVVQDLIAMGLVEAQADPQDRRAQPLRLTAKGRKLVAKFAEMGREVNATVMAGIDEAKGRELVDLFEQMKLRTRMAAPRRKGPGK